MEWLINQLSVLSSLTLVKPLFLHFISNMFHQVESPKSILFCIFCDTTPSVSPIIIDIMYGPNHLKLLYLIEVNRNGVR
jgi:hypothetical protein